MDHRKGKGIPKKIYFCFIDYAKAFDCVYQNKLWKILKEMGIPDHLSCLLNQVHDPHNHDGVITHLELDILEFEVKWALGSITTKLVEVMEFQLS